MGGPFSEVARTSSLTHTHLHTHMGGTLTRTHTWVVHLHAHTHGWYTYTHTHMGGPFSEVARTSFFAAQGKQTYQTGPSFPRLT